MFGMPDGHVSSTDSTWLCRSGPTSSRTRPTRSAWPSRMWSPPNTILLPGRKQRGHRCRLNCCCCAEGDMVDGSPVCVQCQMDAVTWQVALYVRALSCGRALIALTLECQWVAPTATDNNQNLESCRCCSLPLVYMRAHAHTAALPSTLRTNVERMRIVHSPHAIHAHPL